MVEFGELTYREIRQHADKGMLGARPDRLHRATGTPFTRVVRLLAGRDNCLCGGGRGYPHIRHLRTRVADAAIRSDARAPRLRERLHRHTAPSTRGHGGTRAGVAGGSGRPADGHLARGWRPRVTAERPP